MLLPDNRSNQDLEVDECNVVLSSTCLYSQLLGKLASHTIPTMT